MPSDWPPFEDSPLSAARAMDKLTEAIVQGPASGLESQRLSRPDLFMSVAELFGRRSSCPRAEVGAIAVLEGRIIASGYVGASHGQPHCTQVGCDMENGHCVRSVHAEANLVAWAARVGTSLLGTTVWCTHAPCKNCAKLFSNTGIRALVWKNLYTPNGIGLLRLVGIDVLKFEKMMYEP